MSPGRLNQSLKYPEMTLCLDDFQQNTCGHIYADRAPETGLRDTLSKLKTKTIKLTMEHC